MMGFSRKSPPPQGARPAGSSLPRLDLQELWFATLRRPWNSLALIPADAGRSCMEIAKALAEVGGMLRRRPAMLLSGENLDLAGTAQLVHNMQSQSTPWTDTPGRETQEGPLVIVALESVITNPTGIAIALAADAALLCVELGETDLASARHTVEMVGRDRFVGCVLLGSG
jgi:hypothetical protein